MKSLEVEYYRCMLLKSEASSSVFINFEVGKHVGPIMKMKKNFVVQNLLEPLLEGGGVQTFCWTDSILDSRRMDIRHGQMQISCKKSIDAIESVILTIPFHLFHRWYIKRSIHSVWQ